MKILNRKKEGRADPLRSADFGPEAEAADEMRLLRECSFASLGNSRRWRQVGGARRPSPTSFLQKSTFNNHQSSILHLPRRWRQVGGARRPSPTSSTDNRQPTTDHRPPTTDHRPGKRKNLPSGYLEKRARSDTAQRRIRFSENLRASCEHRIDDPKKKATFSSSARRMLISRVLKIPIKPCQKTSFPRL
jgi:hypothetical protein